MDKNLFAARRFAPRYYEGDTMQEQGNRQVSQLKLNAGAFSVDAELSVTPTGLLAIAALVSSILLSTAALVRVAKR